MGRDFIHSMLKMQETKSKPLPVAGLMDSIPKAETTTDAHSLDNRQVANLRDMTLRDIGQGRTVADMDYDHRLLDESMTRDMIQRPFDEFIAFENIQEKPSYQYREKKHRGMIYGAAAGARTKTAMENVSNVA